MEEDRKKLIAFLTRLEWLLLRDIENNIDNGLKRYAECALLQFHERFGVLREALRDPVHDEALERVGLTGPELDLKLFAFNREADIYETNEGAQRRGAWGRAKGFVRGIFGWFNSKWRSFARLILSSLAEALNVAEPVKALTEVFGIALEG